MLRTLLTAALAASLFAAAAGAADETYTVKLYKDKKGDKTENEKTEDTKNKIAVTFMGMDNNQDLDNAKKEVYVEEILEVKEGERKPTKLTRTYSVAEKTEKGEKSKLAYSGKTVLIEKKGKKYEFSIDGEALKEADAVDLNKSFNKSEDEPREEDLMPTEAIKVGGTWKVPVEKSEKMFKSLNEDKMKVDVKKSTIAGKLIKAYKKDGAQFATLELTITVFVTELDLGSGLTKATGKFIVKGTVDTCIDGTVQFQDGKKEVTMDIAADLPNDGKFKMTGTTSGIEKTRVAKK